MGKFGTFLKARLGERSSQLQIAQAVITTAITFHWVTAEQAAQLGSVILAVLPAIVALIGVVTPDATAATPEVQNLDDEVRSAVSNAVSEVEQRVAELTKKAGL